MCAQAVYLFGKPVSKNVVTVFPEHGFESQKKSDNFLFAAF
jgi:hypothetical protein